MRNSLKDKRDSIDFEREKDIQAFLHQQMAAGKLLIYYFDGSGFTPPLVSLTDGRNGAKRAGCLLPRASV